MNRVGKVVRKVELPGEGVVAVVQRPFSSSRCDDLWHPPSNSSLAAITERSATHGIVPANGRRYLGRVGSYGTGGVARSRRDRGR